MMCDMNPHRDVFDGVAGGDFVDRKDLDYRFDFDYNQMGF